MRRTVCGASCGVIFKALSFPVCLDIANAGSSYVVLQERVAAFYGKFLCLKLQLAYQLLSVLFK